MFKSFFFGKTALIILYTLQQLEIYPVNNYLKFCFFPEKLKQMINKNSN
jgi:hypothetical protein